MRPILERSLIRKFLFFGTVAGLISYAIFLLVTTIWFKPKSLFVLTHQEVGNVLEKHIPDCNKIEDCFLQPGDILIRRYLTSRVRLFVGFLHPYYTHSAVYAGEGRIIEAVGDEPAHNDEIKSLNLLTSDWMGPLENWVILRPKASAFRINLALADISRIADDPDYTFGIPWNGNTKQTSCANLILDQYIKAGIIESEEGSPSILTPDYLFWATATRPDLFTIIGFK